MRSSRNKARSAGPLRFHTDRVDVVTLLCVRPAASGGLSKVASAVAVHNAILDAPSRPARAALPAVLPHASGRGRWRGRSTTRCRSSPSRDGRFTSQYSRTFVEAAQRIPEVPRMTAAQDEALDLWAEVCEELCYTMDMRPGDIQLLNNHVVYHARTTYEDDPTPGPRSLPHAAVAVDAEQPRAARGLRDAVGQRSRPGALRGGIAQAVGGNGMNRKRVGILVFPDVEVLDFCGPFEVFSVTRLNEELRRDEQSPFEVLRGRGERRHDRHHRRPEGHARPHDRQLPAARHPGRARRLGHPRRGQERAACSRGSASGPGRSRR